MPAPFKQITRDQFAELLEKFNFTRKINAVHMHHTWKPDHAQYKGHETIAGMWRYHTQTKGWRDIAQHITIAPDGSIWLGRNWNSPPVSAKGHNGNLTAGPFMFEMIGNFDYGNDKLAGEQLRTTLEVITRVQRKFRLPPESLVFHNAMSEKTCPGSSVDFDDIVSQVRDLHPSLGEVRGVMRDLSKAPFGEYELESYQEIQEALESLLRVPAGEESAEAELSHDEAEARVVLTTTEAARGSDLSPYMLEKLRPHLVNLSMGQFSSEGEWKSSRGDVDAIFEEYLPKALEEAQLKKLRVMFFAHGGLVKESEGLKIAQKHVDWWKQNGIYPIYFIWETGAFETIWQLLNRSKQRTVRAISRDIFDHTTDPLIEDTVRALQGPRIWSGMKLSAQLASSSVQGNEGGAWYVAQKLSQFCAANQGKVELHAVGHSAGSIFHSYFIPAALDLGAPHFKSIHFMAPAVCVDTFKAKLADRIGNGIDQLSIFTMNKSYEQSDYCASIYQKSLLYLIYFGLEAERKTPILGLEESIRSDSELKKLLGLGVPGAPGEVIWSVSLSTQGRNASTSKTHGGFDDDGPTMSSIARRILDKADADTIVEYVTGQRDIRGVEMWKDQVDWPEQIKSEFMPSAVVSKPTPISVAPAISTPPLAGAGAGRRRALCVGINQYPSSSLFGCVADAQDWASAFRRIEFEDPIMLLDEKASRAAIIENLTSLVTSSRSGDVIVFQYSGHGTQLPDVNKDEQGGDTPGQDEAICPYDFADGAFLIDDDIGEIFNRLPGDVNLTCFIDCCHSGTITRFAVGTTPGAGTARADERPRFIVATDAMVQAHRLFRESLGRRRAITSGGPSLMKEVVFSACLSSEVAWESGGHGEFTVNALKVLQSGIDGMSNEQFERQVTGQFGATPRQHAQLNCKPSDRVMRLLQPLSVSDRQLG
jgi:hypothetical protein